MSAKGMKQGPRARKGGNRQEGERPWSRNEPGQARPGTCGPSEPGCAEGETNLRGGAADAAATTADVSGWSSSEGGVTP